MMRSDRLLPIVLLAMSPLLGCSGSEDPGAVVAGLVVEDPESPAVPGTEGAPAETEPDATPASPADGGASPTALSEPTPVDPPAAAPASSPESAPPPPPGDSPPPASDPQDPPPAPPTTSPALPTTTNNFYVDGAAANASDTNSGSEAAPLKTIQRAADLVAPDTTVWVRAGTYLESVQIKASGKPDARIVFRVWGAGKVVIDGQNQRDWCVVIGRNSILRDAGHYVTLDGFVCKNPRGTGFGGDGLAAGILILGTEGVVVRNCEAFRDDYPGFPGAFPPPAYNCKGIYITGYNVDTVIEYCTVHRVSSGGIGSRLNSGDVGGVPIRPVLRWNHVSWCNIDDDALQNYAGGMGFGNGTIQGLAEYNLVHHCADFGVATDDSSGHTLRYNICYRMNHTASGGGGGDGLKTKPGNASKEADVLNHNVAFLNQGPGYNINVIQGMNGPRLYNNLSYANDKRGITCTSNLTPPSVALIRNNICYANVGQDLKHPSTQVGAVDYNLLEDGQYDAAKSPHTLVGATLFGEIGLLSIDSNGDGTPDAFDPLNDLNAFPGAAEAIAYAREQVRRIFTPPAGARTIDAGTAADFTALDLLGRAAFDAPDAADPWTNDNQAGVVDLGPLERPY